MIKYHIGSLGVFCVRTGNQARKRETTLKETERNRQGRVQYGFWNTVLMDPGIHHRISWFVCRTDSPEEKSHPVINGIVFAVKVFLILLMPVLFIYVDN